MVKRSIMPEKSDSAPIGSCIRTACLVNRSKIDWKDRSKDPPVLSSLLMKQIRGTIPSSAYLQLVSDCGSTPATPSKTTTAPSSTRKDRFTSAVKSMCPGVSMILKRTFLLKSSFGMYEGFQKQVIAAEVM